MKRFKNKKVEFKQFLTKKMKKIILSLVLISFLALPVLASAVQEPLGEEIPDLNVVDTLRLIADWIFYILLFVAAIFIVVAGLTFVTASGDPEKVKKARDAVMYAVVGIIVALLSRGIVILVNQMIGTGGPTL